ncbi:MAG: DNA polymerase III subunit delta [Vibrio sp.]
MRTYPDKLPEHLKQRQYPVYLVFGSDPLLRQEASDEIWRSVQQQGVEEKYRYTLDAQLDWESLYQQVQAFGLFSSKELYIFDIPESGIPAAAQKPLAQLLSMQHADVQLLFVASKFSRATENTKWFKSLHQNGLLVICNTPELKYLPQFVAHRCRQLKLEADQESIQMLAQWHEGNLLALKQSLEKLVLLYPDGKLTLLRVEAALSRHNHFTPFQWVDALLEGKANRAQRILRQLQAEGVEAIILLRTLQKELFQVLTFKQQSLHTPLPQLFNQYKVWQNKRPLYQAALNRLSLKRCRQLITDLTQVEIAAKTSYDQDIWPMLSRLSIDLSRENPVLLPN